MGVVSELLGSLWTHAGNPTSCLEMSNEKIRRYDFSICHSHFQLCFWSISVRFHIMV